MKRASPANMRESRQRYSTAFARSVKSGKRQIMSNKVTVATHAGFCFGVKRATGMLEEKIARAQKNEKIYGITLIV